MKALLDFVATELAASADAEKAAAMAAYMKTTDPFYGVQKPGRVPILREIKARFPPNDVSSYRAAVLALWSLPHREEKYLALAVASSYPEYMTTDMLPLYRQLISEGAWWDFVDEVAVRCVSKVWLDERTETSRQMEQWIDVPDMWLRRTAIIGQLKHKTATDEPLLFGFCLRSADETEFFIRKAIGWALREYAKTSPDSVRRFAIDNSATLSALSFREATKHLDVS